MTTKPEFRRLLEPITVGQMNLKNRMVMPPMATRYADPDGFVTERLKSYYEARARGGVGLIIVEVAAVDPAGIIIPNMLRADEDRFIPGLAELAEVIHRHGAKTALQLVHGGRMARRELTDLQPAAPSPVAGVTGEMPRELTTADIEELVDRFAEAAGRARKAGFDAVEIHGAHAYIIAQFLSPASNKRQDSYGGDLAGRARFLLEVARAIREEVGAAFTVLCRLNGKEFGIPDGITLPETQQVSRMLQDAGVDGLHISSFGVGHPTLLSAFPLVPGLLVPLAESVKRVVNIPVITVGKLDPELGERSLQDGKADLVAFGRALIADPKLPNKVAQGCPEDIRPCIACLNCLHGIVWREESLRCRVNPAKGRERECALAPAARPKKVLVVGGGPAGMEAARVAASRGHRVTLYEKAPELGGQLLVADKPPYKEDIGRLTRYLVTQLEKAGVETRLGQEATPATVDQLRPEAVVVAVGSTPTMPKISGLEKARVVSALDVLSGRAQVGPRVVVIGGEVVGCETAEFLADKGHRVTVTRRGAAMATRTSPTVRMALLGRLAEKGVNLLCEVKYSEVTEQGLVLSDKQGHRRLLEADTIVLASGAQPDTGLAKALRGKAPEVHAIGDCVEPRDLDAAIAEGYAVGRQL